MFCKKGGCRPDLLGCPQGPLSSRGREGSKEGCWQCSQRFCSEPEGRGEAPNPSPAWLWGWAWGTGAWWGLLESSRREWIGPESGSGWGNRDTPAFFSFLESPPSHLFPSKAHEPLPGGKGTLEGGHFQNALADLLATCAVLVAARLGGARSSFPQASSHARNPHSYCTTPFPPPPHHMLCSNHTDLSVLGTLCHFLPVPKPAHQLKILPPVSTSSSLLLSVSPVWWPFPHPHVCPATCSLKLSPKPGHMALLGSGSPSVPPANAAGRGPQPRLLHPHGLKLCPARDGSSHTLKAGGTQTLAKKWVLCD